VRARWERRCRNDQKWTTPQTFSVQVPPLQSAFVLQGVATKHPGSRKLPLSS